MRGDLSAGSSRIGRASKTEQGEDLNSSPATRAGGSASLTAPLRAEGGVPGVEGSVDWRSLIDRSPSPTPRCRRRSPRGRTPEA